MWLKFQIRAGVAMKTGTGSIINLGQFQVVSALAPQRRKEKVKSTYPESQLEELTSDDKNPLPLTCFNRWYNFYRRQAII